MASGEGDRYETLDGVGGDITVWDKCTLKEKLCEVDQGSVQLGESFIYYIWKSLLNKWFGYTDSKVYLVTPFLDAERLEDVCRLILHTDAQDKLANFFVRNKCNYDIKIEDIKRQVKKKFTGEKEARKRLQNIFEKVNDPGKKFHAKFIACVSGEEAEVLVMSANFHAHHFDFDNIECVHYTKITKELFEKRFLRIFQ